MIIPTLHISQAPLPRIDFGKIEINTLSMTWRKGKMIKFKNLIFVFSLIFLGSLIEAHQSHSKENHHQKSDSPLTKVSVIEGNDILSGKMKRIDFSESKGSIVVLFLSTVCPCTNGSMMKISNLIDQYTTKGFEVVVVNLDYKSKISSLKKYYKAVGLKTSIIWDENLRIAKSFGVKMMAESVVVSKDGQMLYRGGIRTEDDQYPLFGALDEIHEGKAVTHSKGKGMGCFLLYPES